MKLPFDQAYNPTQNAWGQISTLDSTHLFVVRFLFQNKLQRYATFWKVANFCDRVNPPSQGGNPTIGCGTLSRGAEPYHGVKYPVLGLGQPRARLQVRVENELRINSERKDREYAPIQNRINNSVIA